MRRYGLVTALLYDVFSGERPFYRAARSAAIEQLHLAPGDRVLVLGSGTGLDLPLIAERIGAAGAIIAVDRSAVMLRASARRSRTALGDRRAGWPKLRLVQADATRAVSLLPPGTPPVDAVLAVNTLSLIPDWRLAWDAARGAARPGARVAVADIGAPAPGSAPMAVWARVISWIGGGDLDAHPWTGVEGDADLVVERSWWRGHVQLRAGSLRRG